MQPSRVWQRLGDRLNRLAVRFQAATDLRRAGFIAGFCAALFVLVNWRNYSADTIAQALVPVRLWRAGTLNLDLYRGYYTEQEERGKGYSFVEDANGHLYPRNSVFVSLLVTPLYLPPVALGVATDNHRFWIAWARLCAAIWTGVAVALSYLTLRRWGSPTTALLFSLLLAFGTGVWTVVGHSIYDHLGALVCVSALALVLDDFPLRPWRAGLAAFLAGAAVGMRPTTLVLLFPIGVYLLCGAGLLAGWKSRLLAGGAVLVVPMCYAFLNASMFGAWYKTGYSEEDTSRWTTPVWEGALGLLFAPNAGLLLQSPFLILAVLGGWAAWRTGVLKHCGLLRCYTVCLLGYWFLYARWCNWQGGLTPASRFLCDGYPLFMPLVVVGWNEVSQRAPVVWLVRVAAVWSILYQILAVALFDSFSCLDPPAANLPWRWQDHFFVEHLRHFGALSALAAIAATAAQFLLSAAVSVLALAPFWLSTLPTKPADAAPSESRLLTTQL